MADSDDDERDSGSGLNLAGFMFGNIDENGLLEEDILDSNAKQHLSAITHLGLGSILSEIISEEISFKEKENGVGQENGSVYGKNESMDDKEDDYLSKDPSAEDFSNIDELAEDYHEEPKGIYAIKYNQSLS